MPSDNATTTTPTTMTADLGAALQALGLWRIAEELDDFVALLSARPMSREALRSALHLRNATLGELLVRLRAEGRIVRAADGFRLPQAVPVPSSTQERERNGPS